jgi:hypothetical protein
MKKGRSGNPGGRPKKAQTVIVGQAELQADNRRIAACSCREKARERLEKRAERIK